MFHIVTVSPSLWTTDYTTLIFDSVTENVTSQLTNTVTENVTPLLRNTTYRENKTEKVSNTEFVNYSILHWPNYLWFVAGLGTGIFIMFIINSNLYCQVWCPNFPILRRIGTFFRILWHRFIVWYRHVCLGRNEYFISTFKQNNRIIKEQHEIALQSLPRVSLSPPLTNQPRSLQQSQLSLLHRSQISQLPRGSRLLQLSNLTNQSQSSSQQSQWNTELPTVSWQSHIPQQLLPPSSSDSNRLLVSPVRNSPATIGNSQITAVIHTSAITTMIATSTTAPGLLTSSSTQ
ncbi:PREDICTED: uncharacterized protein LOC108759863 [Trachymyrmex cornetzi]|uniref:uncharacterized protein LOC108759863 n=1 Tax=Trachymyrmex cornetzi TaxID=471704 RepID=UPI00084F4586|nr:PREDICTED: uncharacterized protein LOC108759863 [Trachymyrmex cornetzi]